MRAEFAEKQYENAANIELARGGGNVFSPGQVEESILGYDAAARPGHDAATVLRQVAGIALQPAVWLTPNWWLRCPRTPPPSALSDRFASLLLQFKRPELVTSPAEPLFTRHDGAFFRYPLRRQQHRILVRLDEALNGEAVVRYAAPCTVSDAQLVQWQLDGAVLPNSNYIGPRRIGLRHSSWTYKAPGSQGYRNEYSEGDEAIPSDSFEEVTGLVFAGDAGDRSLSEHLERLSVLVSGEEINTRAADATSRTASGDRSAAVLAAVRMRLIGLALADTRVMWWLIAR